MEIKFDFLLKEYEEMFSEKRYYDSRFSSLISLYISLITFTVSISAVVTSIVNFQSTILNAIICLLDCISGILIFISLYFNRINYVKVCRQINSIRKFCLENNCKQFEQYNHMYTNDKFPKYLMKNTIHFIFMYFIAVMNSIFLLISLLAFLHKANLTLAIIIAIVSSIVVAISQILIVNCVAKKRDNKSDLTSTF